MVQAGDRVRIDFIGRFDDGAQFSNSYLVGEPFEFTVGEGVMLAAFEREVCKLEVGQEATVRIPCAEAYGPYDEALVERVPVAMIPDPDKLPVGEYVVLDAGEEQLRVKVLKVEDGWVYFDHNHELAGQDLTFDIKLLEVVE